MVRRGLHGFSEEPATRCWRSGSGRLPAFGDANCTCCIVTSTSTRGESPFLGVPIQILASMFHDPCGTPAIRELLLLPLGRTPTAKSASDPKGHPVHWLISDGATKQYRLGYNHVGVHVKPSHIVVYARSSEQRVKTLLRC